MSKVLSIASLQRLPANDGLLATRLDAAHATLWVRLLPAPGRPMTFSLELLGAFEQLLDQLEAGEWAWSEGAGHVRLRYLVLESGHPRFFSLGGDLAYFQRCIESENFGALRSYSQRCLDLVGRLFGAAGEVTTIALVQGRALGGGFETALSATHLIAESQAEFSLPEISFGLFPATGGMALLANRIGLRRAATFVRNAKMHTAAAMFEAGVVDEICETGDGPAAVQAYIADYERHYTARMAIQRSEARLGALDMAELRRVVDDWVSTAMKLNAQERRVLATLVRMQVADAARDPA